MIKKFMAAVFGCVFLLGLGGIPFAVAKEKVKESVKMEKSIKKSTSVHKDVKKSDKKSKKSHAGKSKKSVK